MDANIWIDLDNGGLLEAAFALSYEFASPDAIVVELGPELAEKVRKLGLRVLVTEAEQEVQWHTLRVAHKRPSDADLYGLLHARLLRARLLTGDRHLREAATAEGVDVSGLLWLMEQMVDRGGLARKVAALSLQAILDRGARLPQDECEERLLRWS